MILTGLLVGLLLGIVFQRGRFCVTGMLRDIFLQRSWRTATALLVVISVHAVGLAALTAAGAVSPEPAPFAPGAVVVGALLFGLGIVLAGGCASGTWYRAGEGLVGSWLALGLYALTSAAMKEGALGGLTAWATSWKTGLTTVPAAVHLSPWVFVLGLVLVTAAMVRHFLLRQRSLPSPGTVAGQPLWKRPLGLYTAALLVGLLGVVAWPLSAATGRNDGLGITSPSAHLVQYLATGQADSLDWGVLLVLGILGGSFLAALATGEFRVRVPDGPTAARSVAGGILMGVGASLASGCTVGNGMVQTSLFTVQGWVALVFMALGVGLGARLWIKPSRARSRASSAPAGPAGPQRAVPQSGALGIAGFAAAPGAVALDRPGPEQVRSLGQGRFALDTLGSVCPFPLVRAEEAMAGLQGGQHLVIDFDCTQATEAIPQWAARDGHQVTDFRETGSASWQITLRKGVRAGAEGLSPAAAPGPAPARIPSGVR